MARCHLCPEIVMRADNLKSRHYKTKHPGADPKLMIPVQDDWKSQAPVQKRKLLDIDDDDKTQTL